MQVNGKPYQTIWPTDDGVAIIDQTVLPHEFNVEILRDVGEAAVAISEMKVRGAPLSGITGAYGLYLALLEDPSDANLDAACALLGRTRPTAVNLSWALHRIRDEVKNVAEKDRADRALAIADQMRAEDIDICERIGNHGLALIRDISERKPAGEAVNILTHCNAGWLATIDWGTATAPVYKAKAAGIDVHVWVDETRPRNQGAALTAFELLHENIPHTVIVDNAGGHLMHKGLVDLCFVGTDRTASNGDVANKIGTYLKALAAHDNNVPFYVCAPSPSIDWELASGEQIPIEERDENEVACIRGELPDGSTGFVRIVPDGVACANYGFDVTPARLVTGIVTERGICRATRKDLGAAFPDQRSRESA